MKLKFVDTPYYAIIQSCTLRVSWENKIFDLTLPNLITLVPRSKKVKKTNSDSAILIIQEQSNVFKNVS